MTKKELLTFLRSNFDPTYLMDLENVYGKGETQIKCEIATEIIWNQINKGVSKVTDINSTDMTLKLDPKGD